MPCGHSKLLNRRKHHCYGISKSAPRSLYRGSGGTHLGALEVEDADDADGDELGARAAEGTPTESEDKWDHLLRTQLHDLVKGLVQPTYNSRHGPNQRLVQPTYTSSTWS